jgi:error-prone DNA polymerase
MYAELHCLSNFSFLRGASRGEELVERAAQLGYAALAITDECSVAGVVRAHVAAREHKLKLIVGAEFRLEDGLRCVLLARDRTGYGRLCRLITRGRRAATKGSYKLTRADFEELLVQPTSCPSCPSSCLCLWLPAAQPNPDEARWLASLFPGQAWIAVELLTTGRDRRRLAQLQALGQEVGLPLVASGDVHMHSRGRRALQDVLTATRLGTTVEQAGLALFPNGERHLRPVTRIAELHPPELLAATLEIAAQCTFSLDELRYEYPREIVPDGYTPAAWLRQLTEEGARQRWPQGMPQATRQAVRRVCLDGPWCQDFEAQAVLLGDSEEGAREKKRAAARACVDGKKTTPAAPHSPPGR